MGKIASASVGHSTWRPSPAPCLLYFLLILALSSACQLATNAICQQHRRQAAAMATTAAG